MDISDLKTDLDKLAILDKKYRGTELISSDDVNTIYNNLKTHLNVYYNNILKKYNNKSDNNLRTELSGLYEKFQDYLFNKTKNIKHNNIHIDTLNQIAYEINTLVPKFEEKIKTYEIEKTKKFTIAMSANEKTNKEIGNLYKNFITAEEYNGDVKNLTDPTVLLFYKLLKNYYKIQYSNNNLQYNIINNTKDEFSVEINPSTDKNKKITLKIYTGDIGKSTSNIIVDTLNNRLTLGVGVAGRINDVGGENIQKELDNIKNYMNNYKINDKFEGLYVTGAGNFKNVNKIYHIVGPNYYDIDININNLKIFVKKILEITIFTLYVFFNFNKQQFATITFPTISTGEFLGPKENLNPALDAFVKTIFYYFIFMTIENNTSIFKNDTINIVVFNDYEGYNYIVKIINDIINSSKPTTSLGKIEYESAVKQPTEKKLLPTTEPINFNFYNLLINDNNVTQNGINKVSENIITQFNTYKYKKDNDTSTDNSVLTQLALINTSINTYKTNKNPSINELTKIANQINDTIERINMFEQEKSKTQKTKKTPLEQNKQSTTEKKEPFMFGVPSTQVEKKVKPHPFVNVVKTTNPLNQQTSAKFSGFGPATKPPEQQTSSGFSGFGPATNPSNQQTSTKFLEFEPATNPSLSTTKQSEQNPNLKIPLAFNQSAVSKNVEKIQFGALGLKTPEKKSTTLFEQHKPVSTFVKFGPQASEENKLVEFEQPTSKISNNPSNVKTNLFKPLTKPESREPSKVIRIQSATDEYNKIIKKKNIERDDASDVYSHLIVDLHDIYFQEKIVQFQNNKVVTTALTNLYTGFKHDIELLYSNWILTWEKKQDNTQDNITFLTELMAKIIKFKEDSNLIIEKFKIQQQQLPSKSLINKPEQLIIKPVVESLEQEYDTIIKNKVITRQEIKAFYPKILKQIFEYASNIINSFTSTDDLNILNLLSSLYTKFGINNINRALNWEKTNETVETDITFLKNLKETSDKFKKKFELLYDNYLTYKNVISKQSITSEDIQIIYDTFNTQLSIYYNNYLSNEPNDKNIKKKIESLYSTTQLKTPTDKKTLKQYVQNVLKFEIEVDNKIDNYVSRKQYSTYYNQVNKPFTPFLKFDDYITTINNKSTSINNLIDIYNNIINEVNIYYNSLTIKFKLPNDVDLLSSMYNLYSKFKKNVVDDYIPGNFTNKYVLDVLNKAHVLKTELDLLVSKNSPQNSPTSNVEKSPLLQPGSKLPLEFPESAVEKKQQPILNEQEQLEKQYNTLINNNRATRKEINDIYLKFLNQASDYSNSLLKQLIKPEDISIANILYSWYTNFNSINVIHDLKWKNTKGNTSDDITWLKQSVSNINSYKIQFKALYDNYREYQNITTSKNVTPDQISNITTKFNNQLKEYLVFKQSGISQNDTILKSRIINLLNNFTQWYQNITEQTSIPILNQVVEKILKLETLIDDITINYYLSVENKIKPDIKTLEHVPFIDILKYADVLKNLKNITLFDQSLIMHTIITEVNTYYNSLIKDFKIPNDTNGLITLFNLYSNFKTNLATKQQTLLVILNSALNLKNNLKTTVTNYNKSSIPIVEKTSSPKQSKQPMQESTINNPSFNPKLLSNFLEKYKSLNDVRYDMRDSLVSLIIGFLTNRNLSIDYQTITDNPSTTTVEQIQQVYQGFIDAVTTYYNKVKSIFDTNNLDDKTYLDIVDKIYTNFNNKLNKNFVYNVENLENFFKIIMNTDQSFIDAVQPFLMEKLNNNKLFNEPQKTLFNVPSQNNPSFNEPKSQTPSSNKQTTSLFNEPFKANKPQTPSSNKPTTSLFIEPPESNKPQTPSYNEPLPNESMLITNDVYNAYMRIIQSKNISQNDLNVVYNDIKTNAYDYYVKKIQNIESDLRIILFGINNEFTTTLPNYNQRSNLNIDFLQKVYNNALIFEQNLNNAITNYYLNKSTEPLKEQEFNNPKQFESLKIPPSYKQPPLSVQQLRSVVEKSTIRISEITNNELTNILLYSFFIINNDDENKISDNYNINLYANKYIDKIKELKNTTYFTTNNLTTAVNKLQNKQFPIVIQQPNKTLIYDINTRSLKNIAHSTTPSIKLLNLEEKEEEEEEEEEGEGEESLPPSPVISSKPEATKSNRFMSMIGNLFTKKK